MRRINLIYLVPTNVRNALEPEDEILKPKLHSKVKPTLHHEL